MDCMDYIHRIGIESLEQSPMLRDHCFFIHIDTHVICISTVNMYEVRVRMYIVNGGAGSDLE